MEGCAIGVPGAMIYITLRVASSKLSLIAHYTNPNVAGRPVLGASRGLGLNGFGERPEVEEGFVKGARGQLTPFREHAAWMLHHNKRGTSIGYDGTTVLDRTLVARSQGCISDVSTQIKTTCRSGSTLAAPKENSYT